MLKERVEWLYFVCVVYSYLDYKDIEEEEEGDDE